MILIFKAVGIGSSENLGRQAVMWWACLPPRLEKHELFAFSKLVAMYEEKKKRLGGMMK